MSTLFYLWASAAMFNNSHLSGTYLVEGNVVLDVHGLLLSIRVVPIAQNKYYQRVRIEGHSPSDVIDLFAVNIRVVVTGRASQ